MRASAVDVFVIAVELNVPGEREKAPHEEAGNVPLGVLALVGELGRCVWPWMVRANRKAPLGADAIAISPVEDAIRPVEVRPVSIREESSAGKGNMNMTMVGGAGWRVAQTKAGSDSRR